MRLFDIDKNLRDLWTKIEEQEGELTEEDLKALDELNIAKDDKVKGYGIIIRELTGEIDDCEEEIKRIKDIADRKKRKQEWLKNCLYTFMKGQEMTKFESVEVNIGFRKSYQLEGSEIALVDGKLPEQFIVKTTTEKPDKKAITDFIKHGGTIDGCELVEKENIQIK